MDSQKFLLPSAPSFCWGQLHNLFPHLELTTSGIKGSKSQLPLNAFENVVVFDGLWHFIFNAWSAMNHSNAEVRDHVKIYSNLQTEIYIHN